ncbi:hypothetical protein CLV92_1116 [Kineococcus xinjiangensis]|uniref:Uncharacterized protein n=1 Tax=Kineococcus xinjiangensis TaxID=512762 RepID=A0A2S6IG11_9ACTN|nr:hypothetical protein [Kineococcus xinjiangensis]PPK93090.1 hypothetical protein CLV92_1116 [Kineococcus xinjiangensis]
MRPARGAVPVLLLSAVLTACGSEAPGSPSGESAGATPTSPSASETPTESPTQSPSESPSTSTSTATSASPSSAPQEGPLSLVDAVVVTEDGSDPLSGALSAAATGDRTLLLDVVTAVDPASDPTAGDLVIPGRGGGGIRLDLPPEAVGELAQPLVNVTGTFEVTGDAASGYQLTALTTESDPALRPQGMDDAARCAALDQAAVQAAADHLRDDPAARPELRQRWGSSPAVWWAVQVGAHTPGDLAQAVQTACAPYRG